MKTSYKHSCKSSATLPEEFGVTNARASEMVSFMKNEYNNIEDGCSGDLLQILLENARSVEECILYTMFLEKLHDLKKEERSEEPDGLSKALDAMDNDEIEEISNFLKDSEYVPGKGIGIKVKSAKDLKTIEKVMKLKEIFDKGKK